MKTLTTLTAVAALIAGISFASAQNPGGPAPSGSSPSNLNSGAPSSTAKEGQSGSQSGGTAMQRGGTKSSDKIVTGNGRFCITTAAGSNGMECKFASMEACQKEAKTMRRECSQNPNMHGTTGMK